MILCNNRYLFKDLFNTWAVLHSQYVKNWVSTDANSRCLTRAVKLIVEIPVKSALFGISMAVATVAVGVFCLFAAPFRIWSFAHAIQLANQEGLAYLGDKQTTIKERIRNTISNELSGVEGSLRDAYVDIAAAAYGRCLESYMPIAIKWVHSLLEKANTQGKHLVFLARDGIAPYQIAKKILANKQYQKLYPNLTSKSITLAWFSRKILAKAQRDFVLKYSKQVDIPEKKTLIFVDVGYSGSLINPIRTLFSEVECEFEFFISFNDEAHGFAGTNKERLSGFPGTWCLSLYWIEETCQGTTCTADALVEHGGKIYANTNIPGQKITYKDNPLNYLIRKVSMWAVKDYSDIDPNSIDLTDAKKRINRTFENVMSGKLPLLTTGEYL
jgi:hypothetical protein